MIRAMHRSRTLLRLAHSPDPDDAFMWWPLLELDGRPARVDTGRFRFECVIDDIETLNGRSNRADLEITAMSCAQYPFVADRYALTACGASLGDACGPKLVARRPTDIEVFRNSDPVIAIPGERTSAFGVARLMLAPGGLRHEVVPFDAIIRKVLDGSFEAGIVIHEGQLTYGEAGLHLVADLGAWWTGQTRLPIPLGVNAIRRDLVDAFGPGTLEEVTAILLRSVGYALDHRAESIAYALPFARDMGAERADEFVRLYVNAWTLDFGETGRAAVRAFLDRLAEAGLAPVAPSIDFIEARSPAI